MMPKIEPLNNLEFVKQISITLSTAARIAHLFSHHIDKCAVTEQDISDIQAVNVDLASIEFNLRLRDE